jgi:hypothetical protein
VKTPLVLVLCAGLAAGCAGGDDPRPEPPVRTPPVLAGVPVFPGTQVVDTAGTSDAARATVFIPAPPDTVAAFYRNELRRAGWRIVGDRPDSGGVDLFAERDGPPLWVQIRPGPEIGTTRASLIGAVGAPAPRVDSVR